MLVEHLRVFASIVKVAGLFRRVCRATIGKRGPPCVCCKTRVTLNKYKDKLTQHRDAHVIAPIFSATGVLQSHFGCRCYSGEYKHLTCCADAVEGLFPEANADEDEDAEFHYTFAAASPLVLLISFLVRHCGPSVDDYLANPGRLGLPNATARVEAWFKQFPREVEAMMKVWTAQSRLISAVDEVGTCGVCV